MASKKLLELVVAKDPREVSKLVESLGYCSWEDTSSEEIEEVLRKLGIDVPKGSSLATRLNAVVLEKKPVPETTLLDFYKTFQDHHLDVAQQLFNALSLHGKETAATHLLNTWKVMWLDFWRRGRFTSEQDCRVFGKLAWMAAWAEGFERVVLEGIPASEKEVHAALRQALDTYGYAIVPAVSRFTQEMVDGNIVKDNAIRLKFLKLCGEYIKGMDTMGCWTRLAKTLPIKEQDDLLDFLVDRKLVNPLTMELAKERESRNLQLSDVSIATKEAKKKWFF